MNNLDAAKEELARRERVAAAKAELARRQAGGAVIDAPQQGVNSTADEDSGLIDWLAGQVEPTLAMGSSMVAAPVAQIGGGIQMAIEPIAAMLQGRYQDPMAGPDARDRIQNTLTYQPRTDTGQQVMNRIGAEMEPLAVAMQKARLGDEALDAGLPEWAAKNAEAIPEYGGALLAAMALPKPAKPTTYSVNQKTGDLVSSAGRPRPPGVKSRIDSAGKLVAKDRPAIRAAKAGWSEKSIRWINSQPKRVRDNLREMVKIADDYFHKMDADALPTDVIGASATQRVQFLDGVRSRAGRVLDIIADNELAKTRLDASVMRSSLNVQIRKMGGKITNDGIVFGPKSKLYNLGSDAKVLSDLHAKLRAYGRMPTGRDLHQLKQWISDKIDWGKVKPEEGISGGTQTILKGYRKQANEMLRKASPSYKKANDIYSETKGALDTLQKGAGNIDLYGPGASEPVGQVMKRLLSDAQSRNNIKKGVNDIGKLAEKYSKGSLPFEDYTPQMRFVSEMEKAWGAFKEESLKGNMGQSLQSVGQNPSLIQAGREGVTLTARELRRRASSRDRQLATVKELLYQGGD